ncbi:OmpA family protein [uncultured Lamprocystis sp.]|jgi:outer membrane protein OmpA-like peptidoglycan-associated protein|uniref:OmpA family protein n=1 Tax=uncultured Lamprocystis sp. TaxID=543132 RepID=UPI0025EFAA6B|nr:OmpA family protein [uncultured Lamprocystis sp.]
MKQRFVKGVATAATVSVLITGCAADGSGMTETGTGAAIGTATGAALGAIIGSQGANAGRGALIGAVGGALIGGMAGAYMEQQRKDFQKALAAEIASGVIRVEKLPNDELLVGMTGETAFEVDSDQIQPAFYSTMDRIAAIVKKYGKTELVVAGHTDNTGSIEHNQLLSERRAGSVDRYLEGQGVAPARIASSGYGKMQPIASNDTEAGRRLNRRVDITIVPITEG